MKLARIIRPRQERERRARVDELAHAYEVGRVSGRTQFRMGLPLPSMRQGRADDKVQQAVRWGVRSGYEEALAADVAAGVAVFEQLLGEVSP